MKKAIAATCLALWLPLLVAANPDKPFNSAPQPSQPAPPPPAPVVVATFLDLTPSQAAQFQTILGPFLGTLQALEQQISARQQVLEQLLNSPNPNPAVIGGVVLQIHALQQPQAQVIQTFQQAFVSLLTSDQIQKVQAVAQAAQLVPVVGAFESLYLIPPGPAPSQSSPKR